MILDLIVAVILVVAIFKGFQRGLIVGVFSFIAIIIGLAAAIKLSVVVAAHLGKSVNISERWLPVISFILVFIVVVVLVRLGANLIQRTVETAMLGWVNRLGGIFFYIVIYIAVLSVLLFYADQLHLFKQETFDRSATYAYIRPIGPKAVNTFGTIVPFFKNMFIQLEGFFEGISRKF